MTRLAPSGRAGCLGLAIVAAVAHARRATLTAHPGPDGGLHIIVDFPPPPADPFASGRAPA
jgi:signal transduction histidine kinase